MLGALRTVLVVSLATIWNLEEGKEGDDSRRLILCYLSARQKRGTNILLQLQETYGSKMIRGLEVESK